LQDAANVRKYGRHALRFHGQKNDVGRVRDLAIAALADRAVDRLAEIAKSLLHGVEIDDFGAIHQPSSHKPSGQRTGHLSGPDKSYGLRKHKKSLAVARTKSLTKIPPDLQAGQAAAGAIRWIYDDVRIRIGLPNPR
jgi:hypothetical protein